VHTTSGYFPMTVSLRSGTAHAHAAMLLRARRADGTKTFQWACASRQPQELVNTASSTATPLNEARRSRLHPRGARQHDCFPFACVRGATSFKRLGRRVLRTQWHEPSDAIRRSPTAVGRDRAAGALPAATSSPAFAYSKPTKNGAFAIGRGFYLPDLRARASLPGGARTRYRACS